MSTPEPVITVDPVASIRDKTKQAAGATFHAPSYGRKDAQVKGVRPEQQVAQATVIGEAGPAAAASAPTRAAGAVQLVAGSAIALVGVPLLILPGPGLLAIGGGVALAAGGLKKLRRGK